MYASYERRQLLPRYVVCNFISLIVGLAVCLDTASGSCTSPGNTIEAENCLAGTPQSQWDNGVGGVNNGAGDPTIQGFATDQSVNAGSTIRFKVSTNATAYRIE